MRFVLVALIDLVTAGKKGIFAGEPVLPDWIQKLSEARWERGPDPNFPQGGQIGVRPPFSPDPRNLRPGQDLARTHLLM